MLVYITIHQIIVYNILWLDSCYSNPNKYANGFYKTSNVNELDMNH